MHTLRKTAEYAYTGHINNSSLIINPTEYSVNNNYSNIFRCPESHLNKQFTLRAWLWCYQSMIKLIQKILFTLIPLLNIIHEWTLIPMHEKVWVVSHSIYCQIPITMNWSEKKKHATTADKYLIRIH